MGRTRKTPLTVCRRLAVFGALAVVVGSLCALAPRATYAQGLSTWALSPTRVAVTVGVHPACQMSRSDQAELTRAIVLRAEQLIGAAWRVEPFQRPFGEVRHFITTRQPSVPVPNVPWHGDEEQGDATADKWLLLLVVPRTDGFEFAAREYDLRVQQWGPTCRRTLKNRTAWPAVGFRTLFEAYRPVGHVEVLGNRRKAAVHLRGFGLPMRDASLRRFREGDLFEVFVRFNRRDGTARAIRRIDWTVLEVEKPSAAVFGVACHVHSALRSPLARRRGRVETLALMVPASSGTTRLRVESNDNPPRPLAGYTVYDASGPKAVQLGMTNEQGQLTVGPGNRRLRLLWITNGGEPLAPRLPIIPGRADELVVRLPDDGPRLEAAGFIAGLQEEMVDLVVRRRVMLTLARRYLAQGKADAAERLLEKLKHLPTRSQFAVRLTAFEQRLQLADPRSQRKVEQMLRDTRNLLQTHLAPQPIRRLEARIRQARRDNATGSSRPAQTRNATG